MAHGGYDWTTDMTYLFALLTACIFAVELSANIINSEGVIAWIHLIVVGSIEVFLLGYLIVGAVTWVRSWSNPERKRNKFET